MDKSNYAIKAIKGAIMGLFGGIISLLLVGLAVQLAFMQATIAGIASSTAIASVAFLVLFLYAMIEE